MAIKTLDDKLMHELGDIYDAEHRFLEAQREMLKQASASELKTMIKTHIEESEQQVTNLEQVYELLGEKPKREKCDAATGLVSEGQKGMKEAADAPEILDCLIVGSQAKVEHYEMVSYRGLIMLAEEMGNKDAVRLLKENLKQEEKTAQLVEKSLPTLLRAAMKTNAAGA